MGVRVFIEQVPTTGLSAEQLRSVVAGNPHLMRPLEGADPDQLLIGEVAALGHDPGPDADFRATVFDPIANRGIELRGRIDQPEQAEIRASADRPQPRPHELNAAAEILRADPAFPQGDDVVVYRPMPPLADLENADGTTVRRPTLGIYTPSDPTGVRHRVVAVDPQARTVDWTPAGINVFMHHDCENSVPEPVWGQDNPPGLRRVRVRVVKDGVELWNLIVVRPHASAPQNPGDGSGVELRNVRYRGRLILRQAHVPVLNVEYRDIPDTFRDWATSETKFSATGTDPVGAGWRMCTTAPRTILERPTTDAGNFQGVAFHYADGELRIVSELEAGWYRYSNDWRLGEDGTIKPRFGFAATKNDHTCKVHRHHCYWRFDFDIDGAENDIVEQIDADGIIPDPVLIVRETSRKRRDGRFWQVRDKSNGRGLQIHPGKFDGNADAYGVSDLWFLRHHPAELYDGNTGERNKVALNRFVNGEDINGANVVVWYGGHYFHDQEHPEPHQGELLGPDLIPIP